MALANSGNVKVNFKVKMYGYTMGVILLALIQILICLGIYIYAKKKKDEIRKGLIKSKAEFYQFFYDYHKTMPNEESYQKLKEKKN